jgi:hypothetical protein
MDQLEEFAQEESEKFISERSHIVKNLINSFSRRLDAMIARKG